MSVKRVHILELGLKIAGAVIPVIAFALMLNQMLAIRELRGNDGAAVAPRHAMNNRDGFVADWSSQGWGVLRSTDGGRTWQQIFSSTSEVDRLLFDSGGNIIAISDSYPLVVYRSRDSGEHWSAINIPSGMSALLCPGDGMMLAAGSSGVFSSVDSGSTWTKISDGLTQSIRVLAVDSRGTLYAGTNRGILKSTDRAASWHKTGLEGKEVFRLFAGAANEIFAGTDKGLFQSTDEGLTWSATGRALPTKWIQALSGDKEGRVYAAFMGAGVFRSFDRGRSWARILSLGRETITYDVTVSGKNEVFVSAGGCCPVDPSLFYSADSGRTWTKLLNLHNDVAIGATAKGQRGTIFAGLKWVGE